MQLQALTWNLFHGRDFPPAPALRTWRSRLLRIRERDETHIQVNRDLLDEFAWTLADATWDLALLQECPPRWTPTLAVVCDAEGHGVLTSRNSLAALRGFLARLNPDLVASNEGGSNLTLVRSEAAQIVERRELELRQGLRRERRAMAFTRLRLHRGAQELCVSNLHASAGRANSELAEEEVMRAAECSVEWAGDTPLVFGGDLNLRPAESEVFDQLAKRFGLRGSTVPDSLDHLLHRGLRTARPSSAWDPGEREVTEDGLAIRLSDHAPVAVTVEFGRARRGAARPSGDGE